MTQRQRWYLWLRAAGVRMARVAAAGAVGVLSAQAVFSAVDWGVVTGAAALAAIIEFLVCIAGLPEAEFPANLWNGDHEEEP